jgi:hypothetical protein
MWQCRGRELARAWRYRAVGKMRVVDVDRNLRRTSRRISGVGLEPWQPTVSAGRTDEEPHREQRGNRSAD